MAEGVVSDYSVEKGSTFEAGKERLGKGGIVKEEFQEKVLEEVLLWFKENSYHVEKVVPSPILGKSGNKEYLALIS